MKREAADRIEALEAEIARWSTAFWTADNFAVAIHDADGKCYSVRAQDYHRMDDLCHGRTDTNPSRAAKAVIDKIGEKE